MTLSKKMIKYLIIFLHYVIDICFEEIYDAPGTSDEK